MRQSLWARQNGLGRSPWVWVGLICLGACNGQSISLEEQPGDVTAPSTPANCPSTDGAAQRLTIQADLSVADQFDFTAWDIQADSDTVTVQTRHHQLVFCRETQSWAILPPTTDNTSNAVQDQELLLAGEDPAFQTVELAGEAYQYRVLLRPNPFLDFENPPEKAIFELIPPGETEAIALDLYTLEQLRASGIGADLGIPTVTAAIPVEDTLFFAVSSEQGEGFSGLSSLIRYEPSTDSLELQQPDELIATQITDIQATINDDQTTLWLGTKYAAEGSSLIPARGLVAYEFNQDWRDGKISFHTIHNSPLIGAIPTQLHAEGDVLWVATGNGICNIQWRNIDQWDAWNCWRFALEAQVPESGLPIYRSLLAETPSTTLTAATAEVLWWASTVPFGIAHEQPKKGRFEVAYPTGFRVTVPEGAFQWDSEPDTTDLLPWEDRLYWPGEEWHWAGDRFGRSFDEVMGQQVGLGPVGISEQGYNPEGIQDLNALRGDLTLFALDLDSTTVDYFSGWVDDALLEPDFTLVPSEKKPITTESPLKAIATELF
ncbi:MULTISPECIES: hypothetical protein [Cyanophyceae]|uniref:hypothetical protein n=1 Tax=Cyanophyceae TaxID=3028117 RepID=UPI00016DCEBF|nr:MULTISPECIES: hypothetical protein [Cyanophyceae]ACB00654.1 conserved hypothetical protein [Picosynechococcus sp. PCC 7002]SMH51231.1 hypothetical protein SAMN06272755_2300 [Picosynechococcus sp. OG1]SMQ81988.1 hypothetical protein SAMN06272774_1576 [Synechococcus sp. 7002]